MFQADPAEDRFAGEAHHDQTWMEGGNVGRGEFPVLDRSFLSLTLESSPLVRQMFPDNPSLLGTPLPSLLLGRRFMRLRL